MLLAATIPEIPSLTAPLSTKTPVPLPGRGSTPQVLTTVLNPLVLRGHPYVRLITIRQRYLYHHVVQRVVLADRLDAPCVAGPQGSCQVREMVPDCFEEGDDGVVDDVDRVEEDEDELVEEELGNEDTAGSELGAAESEDEGVHRAVT